MGSFLNIQLPVEIERQAQGGPNFNTTILPLNSGNEKRNIEWSLAKASYNIAYGIQTKEDFAAVQNVFYNVFGRAFSFRFKDWADYEIGDRTTLTPQLIAVADGVKTTFQVVKKYPVTTIDGMTTYTFIRPITKPNSVTLPFNIYYNGSLVAPSAYALDPLTGILTPNSLLGAGIQIGVIGEFDVPVRFDTDQLNIQMEIFNAGAIPAMTLKEVINE